MNIERSAYELLELLGYRRAGRPVFPWRDGALGYFSLHSEEDYRSFSGVYLVVYRDKRGRFCVYTRTNSWCSRWDLDQQIRTVRLLKRYFGGTFETDAGKNRYWRNEQTEMAPAEAGCFVAYERFDSSIVRAVHFLSDRQFSEQWSNPRRPKAVLDQLNPRLLANNLLLPYVVAALEDYFKSAFVALAKYCANREALFRNVRISTERMAQVAAGEATLEEVLAESMSFQNLGAIHAHFRALDRRIDLAGTLRRPFGGRRRGSLYDAVEAVISRRHDLIHRNVVDVAFEDVDVARAVDGVYAAVRRCHEHVIAVHGWSPDEHSPPSWSARKRVGLKKKAATGEHYRA